MTRVYDIHVDRYVDVELAPTQFDRARPLSLS